MGVLIALMPTSTQRDAERLVLLCALGSRAAVVVLCAAFDAAVRSPPCMRERPMGRGREGVSTAWDPAD